MRIENRDSLIDSRRSRWRRALAIASTMLAAYCGAKGSPQPPVREPPAAVDGGAP